MSRLLLPILCVLFGSADLSAVEPDRQRLLDRPTPGINFAGPKDYATELPLVDVFKLSRAWISQRTGAGWGEGPNLDLDQHGYVRRLEPGCYVETPMLTIEGGRFPTGTYVLLYRGSGTFGFTSGATIRSRSEGRIEVEVDGSRGVRMTIADIDPSNYPHDIHFVMPGFESTFRDDPWHPDFLKSWGSMRAFRSMDLQHTNNSTIRSADDFPRLDDARYTDHGLPLELLADLANRTGMAWWVCVPHAADDDAVASMADTIAKHLNPSGVLIVEYSNEVWNRQFAQSKYAAGRGTELKLADKPWEATWAFTAKRSLEVFEIFQDRLAQDRLIRVLPSQSANPYVGKQIVRFAGEYAGRPVNQVADALAIAPYVSMNVKADQADEVIAMGPDGVMRQLANDAFEKTAGHIRENATTAKQNGLALFAYEAGQHAVGVGPANQNETLTDMLTAINGTPAMGRMYQRYLKQWADSGGSLICLFSSTSRWGRYGSWGLRQYYDETATDSPKYDAVLRWNPE